MKTDKKLQRRKELAEKVLQNFIQTPDLAPTSFKYLYRPTWNKTPTGIELKIPYKAGSLIKFLRFSLSNWEYESIISAEKMIELAEVRFFESLPEKFQIFFNNPKILGKIKNWTNIEIPELQLSFLHNDYTYYYEKKHGGYNNPNCQSFFQLLIKLRTEITDRNEVAFFWETYETLISTIYQVASPRFLHSNAVLAKKNPSPVPLPKNFNQSLIQNELKPALDQVMFTAHALKMIIDFPTEVNFALPTSQLTQWGEFFTRHSEVLKCPVPYCYVKPILSSDLPEHQKVDRLLLLSKIRRLDDFSCFIHNGETYLLEDFIHFSEEHDLIKAFKSLKAMSN